VVLTKIAESPPTNAGEVRAIVDCPIGDGLIVKASGIFQKNGTTLLRWPTDIDQLLESADVRGAKWILGKYLAVLVRNSGVYLLNQQGQLVVSFTVNSGLGDCVALGEDRDGGLWLIGDTEITRIQCAIEATEFDYELGLPKGWITGVSRYQGKIYTTTQHGFYVLKAAEDPSESPHFLRFGDLQERFFGIAVNGSTACAISDLARPNAVCWGWPGLAVSSGQESIAAL
jgi:hypothetical protein